MSTTLSGMPHFSKSRIGDTTAGDLSGNSALNRSPGRKGGRTKPPATIDTSTGVCVSPVRGGDHDPAAPTGGEDGLVDPIARRPAVQDASRAFAALAAVQQDEDATRFCLTESKRDLVHRDHRRGVCNRRIVEDEPGGRRTVFGEGHYYHVVRAGPVERRGEAGVNGRARGASVDEEGGVDARDAVCGECVQRGRVEAGAFEVIE